MFTTSGLSERNAHELVNPAICPLSVFPSALKLPNSGHCDAGSGQTVKDPFICQSWHGQQEKRKKGLWSLQHPASSMELLRPATGQTLWGLELNSGCLIWPLCICPYSTLINYMAQINNPYYIHCVTKGTTYFCWSLPLLAYFTGPQKGGIKYFLTSSECFGLILSKKKHSFHNHDHI